MSSEASRTRIAVVGVVVTALFGALFARLWYLQVLSAPTYRNAAAQNGVKEVQLSPRRGRILDSAGRELAANRTFPVVLVDRDSISRQSRRDKLFRALGPVLSVEPKTLEARFANDNYNKQQPLPVAEDVDQSVVVYLSEHQAEFPSVTISEGATRIYPYGSLASHVLGYVGRISKEDIDRQTSGDYNLLDSIGKDGIELTYERFLRGTPGKIEYEIDTQGRTVRELSHLDPIPGSDIKLTLNVDIQYLAELSLEQALLQRRFGEYFTKPNANSEQFHWKAPAGTVVIQDPRDGSVLAMASYPNYDQRSFGTISTKEYQDKYGRPEAYGPLVNRALTGLYSPGSTFKLVTAVAGLRTNLASLSETYKDSGAYTIEDCTNSCIKSNAEKSVFNEIALSDAIAVSSDAYFYRIGDKLGGEKAIAAYGGRETLQQVAREFGFGSPSGIALPGEKGGRVPTKKEKEDLHNAEPAAYPDGVWVTGDNVNLAVGQGLLVCTPLQLTNAYSAFANGGQLYQPRIVSEIRRPDGNVNALLPRKNGTPIAFGATLVESAANRAGMLDGMRRVTGERTATSKETHPGTAAKAFVGFRETTGFDIAGKTGTAEVGIDTAANQDTSLFVGFGPVADPKFVVSVVMEQSGFGSAAAAPTVRTIFEHLYGYLPMPVLSPVAMTAPMPSGPKLVIDFPTDQEVLSKG